MNELDRQWAEMLDLATQKADSAGRSDVADYLRLRAENDRVREAGVSWLFDSLIELATDGERAARGVTVERAEPHSFNHENSNIVGTLLTLRHGVRCLSVEAGWTRTPADGFMNGGALAVARVKHFGMAANNCVLSLFRDQNKTFWAERRIGGRSLSFDGERLLHHFAIFLGDRQN